LGKIIYVLRAGLYVLVYEKSVNDERDQMVLYGRVRDARLQVPAK
jgi:hypothetical protein